MPRTTYWERAARRREKLREVALGAVFGSFLVLGMILAPGNDAPPCSPTQSECPE